MSNLPIADPLSNWTPCLRPNGRPLEGRHCRLERMSLLHADALHAAYEDDPEGWDFLYEAPFEDVRDFRLWVVKHGLGRDPLFYTLMVKGKPVGYMSLMRQDPDNGVVEVGNIHIAKAAQRTAASTEAQFLLMQHVFNDLGYRRYEWKCNAQNGPSKRAAERLGFTYEGTFRQHAVVKGKNRDTAWFAMMDYEWPGIAERMEFWLTPSNFDRRGKQKTSLKVR